MSEVGPEAVDSTDCALHDWPVDQKNKNRLAIPESPHRKDSKYASGIWQRRAL